TEGSFRLSVPGCNLSVRAHANERIMRRVENATGKLLAVSQSPQGDPTSFVGGRRRDEIGDGERKGALVRGPDSRPPDVLEAKHPDRRLVLMQGYVEHGADPVGREIVGGEFTCPRIGIRVVRSNELLPLEGSEILGVTLAG